MFAEARDPLHNARVVEQILLIVVEEGVWSIVELEPVTSRNSP